MALGENVTGLISLPASADLSASQFCAVKLDTNGQLALPAAGEVCVGILYTKPNAQGVIAAIHPLDGRKTIAKAGGNIAKGDLLKASATGALVAANKATVNTSDAGAAGDPVIGSAVVGVAVESAVAGDFFQFIALAVGAVATTAS